MPQSVIRPFGVPHPALVTEVERLSLAEQLRDSLLHLSFGSSDRRTQDLRKDVYRGQNKAAETIASMLTEAFNSHRANPSRFANVVWDFFSARVKRLRRTLRQLSPIETRVEGELNCLQVAIDQGDMSNPALTKFIDEIDENVALLMEMRAAVALLMEMRAAAVAERQRRAERS